MKWPPVDWLWERYEECEAWYSGDLARLAGVDGFHGGGEKHKLHVPMARALSNLSAGLLFAGSPGVRVVGAEKLNERLQSVLERCGFFSKILQAAELASAYGGVFLKLNWDAERFSHPLLSVVPANCALPEFVHGELDRVTFWSAIPADEQTGVCYRLEEVYTSDGRIASRLLKGTDSELGAQVPLSSLPQTAGVESEVDSGAMCLLCQYVPNRLPNPASPSTSYGRSDFDGLTGLFSALDEAYSALMRDVRLGKARVIVPMEFLRRKELLLSEAGAASFVFDLNEEIFTALDINPQDSGAGITVVQASVRASEHLQVINDLILRILLLGGFSPQSCGLGSVGQAESGTALNVRERLSMQTAEVKKSYWWDALVRLCGAIVRLDACVFGGAVPEDLSITVTFADNAQPDAVTLAEVAGKLSAAGAASTEAKVRLVNPELSEAEIQTEVGKIAAEGGAV